VNRRGRAGEIVNFVYLDIKRPGNVVPHHLEARIVGQRRNVLSPAGEIVVNAKNLVPIVQKSLAEVRSEEPRAAGHEHALAHQRSSDLYDRRRMAGADYSAGCQVRQKAGAGTLGSLPSWGSAEPKRTRP
jgi:hypothetical protein